MFSLYEPNAKATMAFLRLFKVRTNNQTVNEQLQNHPDWPALLSISDTLFSCGLPNGAGTLSAEDLDILPVPFLAYTKDPQSPLYVVSKISGDEVTLYLDNYKRPKTYSREAFLKKWHGLYLIAERSENSGEKNYSRNRLKYFLASLIPLFLAIVSLALLFYLFNGTIHQTGILKPAFVTGALVQFIILVSGVAVSSLLLWYEIDNNNPVLKKICGSMGKGGSCSAILTGSQSKVFSWLSWSEVGFFYFAGGTLLVLFSESNFKAALAMVAWFNLTAQPYTFYSVYYQGVVAKKWCLLCVSVQLLLVLGTINVLLNVDLFPSGFLSDYFLIKGLVFYGFPLLLWYTMKPFIFRLQQEKNTRRELMRMKFNTDIFLSLLKKQRKLMTSPEGLGIDLGNPSAKHKLIKVCNPYCGPCATAHPQVDRLIKECDNVNVKIIFASTHLKEDIRNPVVTHFMAIASKNDEQLLTKALDDWYLAKERNKNSYEKFARKYPMNGELLQQEEKVLGMEQWCRDANLQFTPTFFFDGYQLPDAYNIGDLQYFLQLEESN
jgi:uncharacterized membrane protein